MSEAENKHWLTARQKVTIYITTVSIVGLVFLVPEVLEFISNLSADAWRHLFIPLMFLALAAPLVAFYAIWSIFSTVKMSIQKEMERNRIEQAVQAAQRQGKPQE